MTPQPHIPKNKLILVSEPDEELRRIVTEALRDSGFDVICSQTHSAIAETLSSGALPSCILLDLNLAPEACLTYLKTLRELLQNSCCALILTSGRLDLPKIAQLCNVKAVLRKPYDLEQMIAIIREEISANTRSFPEEQP